MKLILVLGSPNDRQGNLSQMAQSRLEVCIKLYQEEAAKIVLTGGFGKHFNTSPHPHAFYLRQYLLRAGIPENDIAGLVESSHSVEDATLSKWIIDELKPEWIIVVTSDYHVMRAGIIFRAVYAPFDRFEIAGASSNLVDREVLQALKEHETVAVEDLTVNGVRF
jgi:uncharacterized SAM-binding protein YcdF (DUF218 family)